MDLPLALNFFAQTTLFFAAAIKVSRLFAASLALLEPFFCKVSFVLVFFLTDLLRFAERAREQTATDASSSDNSSFLSSEDEEVSIGLLLPIKAVAAAVC
jgi:hypothetical protein